MSSSKDGTPVPLRNQGRRRNRATSRARATSSTLSTSATSPAPPPSLIRDMPPEERPRQRLLRSGGYALSDAEVLSIVLGSGSRGIGPLGLARDLLDDRGGLFGLVGARPEALRRRGLGEALGVGLVEHLILGGTGRWVSLREQGVL